MFSNDGNIMKIRPEEGERYNNPCTEKITLEMAVEWYSKCFYAKGTTPVPRLNTRINAAMHRNILEKPVVTTNMYLYFLFFMKIGNIQPNKALFHKVNYILIYIEAQELWIWTCYGES